jgi:alpha-glucosidase
VDGFRTDVAHELAKHPALPDNPPRAAVPAALREPGTVADWERLEHRYDLDRPRALDIHRRWRAIADRYGALLLGEVYLLHADKLARYLVPGDGIHAAFWVQPLAIGWDPPALATSLQQAVAATPPGSLAWVQGNHDDQSRAATRFGGAQQGRRRSLAFWTLIALLPGMAFCYQGEELGLTDSAIPASELQDPLAVRNQAPELGRDRVRTPMPWQPGRGHGFTSAPRPWLPDPGRDDADTVAAQRRDPDSFLRRFRHLLHLRHSLRPAAGAPVQWLGSGSPVIGYRPLDAGPYRFIQADALTLRVREGGRTVLVHGLIATGVNADGKREILGFDVTSAEDGAGWLAFFRGLTARGLSGVVLVTSDAHAGLVAAIAATLPGAQLATVPHPLPARPADLR